MTATFTKGLKILNKRLAHEVLPGYDFQPFNTNTEEELFHGDAEHEFFLPATQIHKQVLEGEDPIHSLVLRKQQWKIHFNAITMNGKRCLGAEQIQLLREKIRKTKNDSLVVPQGQIKYLELSRQDPDPDFFGDYNWFYTGGCLKKLCVGGEELLLSTQGDCGDELRVTQLEGAPPWAPVLPSVATVTPKKGLPIFQVVTGRSGLVGARLRNKCVFYSVSRPDGSMPVLEEHGDLKSIRSFLGLDISTKGTARCCTVNTVGAVRLWDMETMRCVSKKLLPQHQGAQVHFGHKGKSVIISNSSGVRWLDTRESKFNSKVLLSERKNVRPCEEISLVFRGRSCRHHLFVATTHSLLQLDDRSPSFSEPVAEWTHQMSSPPLYSDVLILPSGQEVVCIANQRPASVQLVVPSTGQLLKTMTLRDSLFKAQARGECLDHFVNTRLTQSLAGITSLVSDSEETGFSLLSLTAAGDMFRQHSAPGQGSGLRDPPAVPDKTLYLTGRCNMKNVFTGLRNDKLHLSPELPQSRVPQPWHCSKDKLPTYVDALAPILLDVWEIDKIDVDDDDEEEEEWGVQKVNSWLQLSQVSNVSDDMFISQE